MSPDLIGLEDEYLVWENTQPVFVESGRATFAAPDTDPQVRKGLPAPGFDPARVLAGDLTDYAAVARQVSVRTSEKQPSGGVYTSSDTEWWIPQAVLTHGERIAPRDGIVEADGVDMGRRWIVLEAELIERVTWRLVCRDLVIAYALSDSITIERAAVIYDAAGSVVKAWPSGTPKGGFDLYQGLRARVQETDAPIEEERGIRGTARHYSIFVEKPVRVTMEERILWQGVYLDILNTRQTGLIGELPMIEAVRKV